MYDSLMPEAKAKELVSLKVGQKCGASVKPLSKWSPLWKHRKREGDYRQYSAMFSVAKTPKGLLESSQKHWSLFMYHFSSSCSPPSFSFLSVTLYTRRAK